MTFKDLPKIVKDELIERYSNWDMDGEEAFNIFIDKFDKFDLDPSGFFKLSPDDQLTLISGDYKEISHIKSVHNFPEYKNDPNNVIFEDKDENRSRSSEDMTLEEEKAGLEDFISDVKDGNIDDKGIIELENALGEADKYDDILDIIGLSLPIGMIMSGVQVFGKIKSDEIVLNQAPKEYMLQTGKKSVRVALIGTMLASGSPVIVGSTVGYIIYKSRNLLEKISKGIFRVLTSDVTKNIIKGSGKAIIETGSFTGKTIKYTAIKGYNFITHDTTKKVSKGVAKGSHKIGKFIFNTGFNTIKGTGKGVYSIIKNREITIVCENCGELRKIKKPSSSEIYFTCKKCYFMYPIEIK